MATTSNNWKSDARNYQILFLFLFLSYGILVLDWSADMPKFLAIITGCIVAQLGWIHYTKISYNSLRSAMITALGLCILLKGNDLWMLFGAALMAISSKFIFRYQGKHLFNPANFGIVAAMLLSHNVWVSPGQWGTTSAAIVLVAIGGLMVLLRCGRMATGLAFLGTYLAAFFLFNNVYKAWPMDFFEHQAFNASIWLFALFMITDPMTTPNHPKVRLVWAMLVALISLYINQFYWVTAAPIWVLFCSTPLVVVLNHFFESHTFTWQRGEVMGFVPKV